MLRKSNMLLRASMPSRLCKPTCLTALVAAKRWSSSCKPSRTDGPSCTTSTAAKCSASSDADDDSASAFWLSLPIWQRAASNTSRCLIGCSLGDFSALWLLSSYAPDIGVTATVATACAAGIATSMALETVVLRVTESLDWLTAWRTAAGMSLLSMVAMELAENAVELALTGGGAALCTNPTAFWQAMPFALAAGWLTPLPYNYYMLKKYGRGCH